MKYEEKEIWKQELLELGADQLLSWEQKEVFVAPTGYFKNFDSVFTDKLSDERAATNPALFDQLKKQEPFEAPEGYFTNFQEKLFEKINQQKTPSIKPLTRPASWKFASIAATILVFIMGAWLIFSPAISDTQLNEAEIMAFIEAENIDAYTLAEVFDISEISFQHVSNLSEDDIQDLLDESDLNEWDLENIFEDEI